MFRLVDGWEIDEQSKSGNEVAINWFENRLNQSLSEIGSHFEKYRINDALLATYKLVWSDFCSWYLEMIKPAYQAPIDKATYDQTIVFFEKILRIIGQCY